jgi:hypothetical protein
VHFSDGLLDYKLYHSFSEDTSSFGMVTYRESRERKEVLNKFFAPQSVRKAEDMIIDKVKALAPQVEHL